jgi:hypothetical protein
MVGRRSWRRRDCCHCPAQSFDDAPEHNVLGATIYDVELLAALIGAGVGVRVAVDGLERSFSVLKCHLLILLIVVLMDNLLLALPLPRRCAITVRLQLLLLAELLRKPLDLPTLLDTVALGVVLWAPRTALVAAGGLSRSLVTTWAVAPTSHCRRSRSTSQRLVLAAILLLLLFATTMCSCIYIRLASLPCLWSRV